MPLLRKQSNPAFPQKSDNTGNKALHHPLPDTNLPVLLTDASWHTWSGRVHGLFHSPVFPRSSPDGQQNGSNL
ncbi:hypothetical protein BN165_1040029 [Clostridioides difficile E1]|nr:hypothetical protein BN163_1130031 [Clostridioides difficile T5]CCK94160.1 hypothetical protein BN165_1040029 [Clostridioides difficile E1]